MLDGLGHSLILVMNKLCFSAAVLRLDKFCAEWIFREGSGMNVMCRLRRQIKALWTRLGGCVRLVVALSTAAMLSSCGGGDDGSSSYALNVYVTGLTGSGFQVKLNDGAPIGISENSQTTIARLANGTSYTVAISAQPTNPAQVCTATNSSGKIFGNNVDVMINCAVAPIATTSETTVTADSAIPSVAINSIVEVDSPIGSGKIGSSIEIPAQLGGNETMIFAVDANGNILWSSLVTGNSTTLSVDCRASEPAAPLVSSK